MATDKNGKLTYQMKSAGEAWNDHANNDLNAKAVTPAYLDPSQQKGSELSSFQKLLKDVEQDKVALDKGRGKIIDRDQDISR